MQRKRASLHAFTIVELMIVIVVIAILAVIVTVAYNGVQQHARSSMAQSTVSSVSAKIMAFTVDNNEDYPDTLADIGISDTPTIAYTYTVDNAADPREYCIEVTYSNLHYYMSHTQTAPKEGECAIVEDTTIYGETHPFTAALWNDGDGSLKLASYFYSWDDPFTIKGGRVYLPSVPAGTSLTIYYVVGYVDGPGTDVSKPYWNDIPSGLPGQYVTIPSGDLHTGWNDVTFPNSSVIQPYLHGESGHGVWVGYYFSDGTHYVYAPTPGEAAIQSTTGAKLWLAEQSFEDHGRSAYKDGWSGNLYGIDIITQGP